MERRVKNYGRSNPKRWKAFGVILAVVLVIMISFLLYLQFDQKPEKITSDQGVSVNDIENGIHVRTGLKEGEGLMTVVAHCTACHSAQLIIQNRMNKERWNATIRWMQETQNLWPLGKDQEVIVNYLVKNYPVYVKGRRENLQNIEWYELRE